MKSLSHPLWPSPSSPWYGATATTTTSNRRPGPRLSRVPAQPILRPCGIPSPPAQSLSRCLDIVLLRLLRLLRYGVGRATWCADCSERIGKCSPCSVLHECATASTVDHPSWTLITGDTGTPRPPRPRFHSRPAAALPRNQLRRLREGRNTFPWYAFPGASCVRVPVAIAVAAEASRDALTW